MRGPSEKLSPCYDAIGGGYLPYVVFSFVMLISYGRTLAFGLVRDDFLLLSPLSDYRFWHSTHYWRPVWTLWMSLQYQVFGMGPIWMHAMSLILHTVNGCLAFWLLTGMGVGSSIGLATICLWSLLGGNAYAVVWVSHSNDLIAMLFLLLATAAWVSMREPSIRLSLIASGLWLVSLLAKEVGLFWGPAIVIATMLQGRNRRTSPQSLKSRIAILLPLVVLVGYMGAKRVAQGPWAGFNPNVHGDAVSQLKGSSTGVVVAGRAIHYAEGVFYNILPLDLFRSVPGLTIGVLIGASLLGLLARRSWAAHWWKDDLSVGALSWLLLFSAHAMMTPHPRTLYIPTLGASFLVCTLVLSGTGRRFLIVTALIVAAYVGMQVRLGQQVSDFFSPSSRETLISSAKMLRKGDFINAPDKTAYLRQSLSYVDVDKLAEETYEGLGYAGPWRRFVKATFKTAFQSDATQ
jgi:hypothetical protein